MDYKDNYCLICGSPRQPLISVYTEIAYGGTSDVQTLLDCMLALTCQHKYFFAEDEQRLSHSFCERCGKTLEVAFYLYVLSKELSTMGDTGKPHKNDLVTVSVLVGKKENKENNHGYDADADWKHDYFFKHALDLIKYVKCVDCSNAMAPKVAAAEEPLISASTAVLERNEPQVEFPNFAGTTNYEYVKCGKTYIAKLLAPMAAGMSQSNDSGYIDDGHSSAVSLAALPDSSFVSMDANMAFPINVGDFVGNTTNVVPPSPMQHDEGIDCKIYYDIVPHASAFTDKLNDDAQLQNFAPADVVIPPTPIVQPPYEVVPFNINDDFNIAEILGNGDNLNVLLNDEPMIFSGGVGMVEQTKEELFACNLCDFNTTGIVGLREHYANVHSPMTGGRHGMPTEELEKITFKCNNCGFTTSQLLDMHFHAHHLHAVERTQFENSYSTVFGCGDCSKTFETVRYLRTHYTMVHGKSKGIKQISNNIFICEYCDQEFKFKSGLKVHQRCCCRFSEPIKCDKCGNAQFATLFKLEDHLKSVHGIQLVYQCEICRKSFKTREYLSRHRRRHTERHFACQRCDRTYVNESELKKHINRIHMNGHLQKSLACTKCNCYFASAADLKNHRQMQHRLKCQLCSAEFQTRYALRTHSYEHTGKPYYCEPCRVYFVRRHNMVRHAKTVHKVDMTDEDLNEMYTRNIGQPNRHYAFAPKNNDLMLLTDSAEEELLAAELQEIGIDINDICNFC